MTFNILIAGVGGQGTVLASKLIAGAAMKSGLDVRTTETIGMAQRGGSVLGHTRIGDNIHSPLIKQGNADLIIAFEPSEAARQLAFLAEKGTLVMCDSPVYPVAGTGSPYNPDEVIDYIKANVKNLIIVSGQTIKEKYAKMINTALLGAAAANSLFPFDVKALEETIHEMPRFKDENIAAFTLGGKICSR